VKTRNRAAGRPSVGCVPISSPRLRHGARPASFRPHCGWGDRALFLAPGDRPGVIRRARSVRSPSSVRGQLPRRVTVHLVSFERGGVLIRRPDEDNRSRPVPSSAHAVRSSSPSGNHLSTTAAIGISATSRCPGFRVLGKGGPPSEGSASTVILLVESLLFSRTPTDFTSAGNLPELMTVMTSRCLKGSYECFSRRGRRTRRRAPDQRQMARLTAMCATEITRAAMASTSAVSSVFIPSLEPRWPHPPALIVSPVDERPPLKRVTLRAMMSPLGRTIAPGDGEE
jgi:hypothetical protein